MSFDKPYRYAKDIGMVGLPAATQSWWGVSAHRRNPGSREPPVKCDIRAYVLEAAKRVEKLLAAVEGMAAQAKDGDSADDVPELDADLIACWPKGFERRFGCCPPAERS